MEEFDDTLGADRDRRGLRLLLVVLAAVVLGILTALRLLDAWAHGGVRTAGLVFLGVFFTVGGLLSLVPGFWRWQTRSSTWTGRTVFGTMPPREELPAWRRALWDLQEVLIARDRRLQEAMRRDPWPYQLRVSAVTVSVGVTILLYAALR